MAAFIGIMLVNDLPAGIAGGVDLTGAGLGLAAALAFVGIVICNKCTFMSRSAWQVPSVPCSSSLRPL